MRPYKVSLAAGGAQDVPAAGSYVYAIATPGGPVTVHAYDVSGALVLEGTLHAGRGLLCPPFVRLHLENGATAQMVEIQAGFGQVQDVGLVSVSGVVETAPDYSRAMRGEVFFARAAQPAVAGRYSSMELENPAGSGMDLVIPGFHITGPTGGTAVINMNQADSAGLAAVSVKSTKVGAAVSVGKIRGWDDAAYTPVGTVLFGFYADGTSDMSPAAPWILPPGKRIVVQNSAVNSLVGFQFSYFEVPA